MKTIITSLFAAFSTLSVAACSSAEGDQSLGSVDMGLVSACQGSYTCAFADGTSLSTKLSQQEGKCFAGKMALNPDGSTSSSDIGWKGDRNTFSLCSGADCATCNNDAPVSAPSKPSTSGGKKCVGSLSCSSSPPCGPVGCNMNSHYHYDGKGNVSYVDYSCSGSPSRTCDEYGGEDTCVKVGCRWE
jgi:hypothetical protein